MFNSSRRNHAAFTIITFMRTRKVENTHLYDYYKNIVVTITILYFYHDFKKQ